MSRVFKSSFVFWFLGLPAVLLFVFVMVAGSRILINPTEMSVTPCGDVVITRNYPMRELLGINYPIVRYVTTITPLTEGHYRRGYSCREDNGAGQRYNHDLERGFGSWSVKHYAADCMSDPVGVHIDVVYTALLFDMIPLRPVNISMVALHGNGGWHCPQRGPRGPVGPAGPAGPQGERGQPGLNWWELE